MNKCDECGIESESVIAGRWIFYCPVHKQIDLDKTYDNEIAGREDLENMDYELLEQFI